MSNDEKQEDSRFSFITVSSYVDSQEINTNKMKNTMLAYPEISEAQEKDPNAQSKQELITMSMSGLHPNPKERSDFMPLQINSDKIRKNVLPYLVVEDKGEKKD